MQTPELYILSLHDALPICAIAYFPPAVFSIKTGTARSSPSTHLRQLSNPVSGSSSAVTWPPWTTTPFAPISAAPRSEEHTSELQSRGHFVCRLLLEKK